MSQVLEYDLYLDESGDFMETSTNPRERSRSKSRKDKAPSQLGALLVPRGDVDQATRAILQTAKTKAQLPLKEPIHARDIPYGYQYLTMADVIIKGVERQTSWQPAPEVREAMRSRRGASPGHNPSRRSQAAIAIRPLGRGCLAS